MGEFRVVNSNALFNALQKQHILRNNDKVVVAVSGGADSLCLLHLLVRLRERLDLALHVGHLDHQLRGRDSVEDAEFVKAIATMWKVPVTIAAADVSSLAIENRLGVEEAARKARYDFLIALALKMGFSTIALGHNADDQAETVLMHVLRGSGLAGLRGMLPSTTIKRSSSAENITLIRPLLSVSRADIEAYCTENGLQPRVDNSNWDPSYHRNWLRHQVLPILEQERPGLRNRLCQTAAIAAADYELLRIQLDRAWEGLVFRPDDAALELELSRWQELPLALKRMALRRAYHELRPFMPDLGFSHVEGARRLAEAGRTGSALSLPQGVHLSIRYGRLLLTDSIQATAQQDDWPLLSSQVLLSEGLTGKVHIPESRWRLSVRSLPATGQIRALAFDNQDRWRAYLDAETAGASPILRTRRPGERFQPLGMKGQSMLVSDFMINARIPATARDSWPLLANGATILWIAGWRVDHRARITDNTRRILRIDLIREDEDSSRDDAQKILGGA